MDKKTSRDGPSRDHVCAESTERNHAARSRVCLQGCAKSWWIRSSSLVSLRCVLVVWLSEPQVTIQRRWTQQHGDGLVLCDLDQAATPQQASADFFLHTTRQHVYVISPDLYAGIPMQHRCRTC